MISPGDEAPPIDGVELGRRPTALFFYKVTCEVSQMAAPKAQLLAVHAGRLKDQGKIEPAHISMLKRNNVTIALECARLSRDLLGANGITDEYPIMRHLCNLETVKTYEGTDHIHALVIGERVTGIAAYK